MIWNIKPKPDFARIQTVLKRGVPDRVPFYELFSDIEQQVLAAIGKLPSNLQSDAQHYKFKCHVEYMFNLGYDYINIGRNWDFPKTRRDGTQISDGERKFVTSIVHEISNREDFEKYQWPDIDNLDYSRSEDVKTIMPDGMKVIALCAGILENVMLLLGHEGISYMLFDDADLVSDTFEKVADCIIRYYDRVAAFDSVGALSLSDDMGFKTQTLLPPDIYRKYLFPCYKKLVNVIHSHGKLAILHSCGKINNIMDDLIDCGWDAKHSFEDEIMPVWEAKEKYGNRIALLGGFDMDKISTMTPQQGRIHTKTLLEKCSINGGWAVGTGNSVANYVPVENFLAMLDEAYHY